MRLEYESEKEFKKEILRILGKYLDLNKYKIFFFGSRVNGKGSERSDIDIGIEGENPIPVIAKSEIEDEIENLRTLYKIEIVDFSKVSSKFKKVAKQRVEYLN